MQAQILRVRGTYACPSITCPLGACVLEEMETETVPQTLNGQTTNLSSQLLLLAVQEVLVTLQAMKTVGGGDVTRLSRPLLAT